MATIPHCGHARNRGALAQGRIPFVLEADLQGQEARRKTTDVEEGSGPEFKRLVFLFLRCLGWTILVVALACLRG
jgi:hypothetical protein